ncbi:unnamed protein product [Auanema sp. JU1783]|nr:unnamed protein product [Auanema sp. JU1783]
MSWKDYIEINLLNTGTVSKAAIIGLDGNAWACSFNFNVSPQEGLKAANGFENPASVIDVGMYIDGQKYVVLSANSECILGKHGREGVVLYKTVKAIIVSMYDSGIQPGPCNATTGALADYFKRIGY